tara:strand:- start:136 stop:396 length:261 start_codon:yes stop_codon:yes gene_type:complete
MKIKLKLDGLSFPDDCAFDLLYFALKAEYERQIVKQIKFEKENTGEKQPVNINCVILSNMLRQIEEQHPQVYLISESLYNSEKNNG